MLELFFDGEERFPMSIGIFLNKTSNHFFGIYSEAISAKTRPQTFLHGEFLLGNWKTRIDGTVAISFLPGVSSGEFMLLSVF